MDLGKDADIDFNIVSSVFGKRLTNVVDWINKGLATYIDKEKALSFLSHQSAPIAEAAANKEPNFATKVVKGFENPIEREGNNTDDHDEIEQPSPDTNRQRIRDEAQNMGKSLGVEVRIVENTLTKR